MSDPCKACGHVPCMAYEPCECCSNCRNCGKPHRFAPTFVPFPVQPVPWVPPPYQPMPPLLPWWIGDVQITCGTITPSCDPEFLRDFPPKSTCEPGYDRNTIVYGTHTVPGNWPIQ